MKIIFGATVPPRPGFVKVGAPERGPRERAIPPARAARQGLPPAAGINRSGR